MQAIRPLYSWSEAVFALSALSEAPSDSMLDFCWLSTQTGYQGVAVARRVSNVAASGWNLLSLADNFLFENRVCVEVRIRFSTSKSEDVIRMACRGHQ